MNITDKNVLKELKRVKSYELEESLATYPDDERDGRTDVQMLADECSYILSNFSEDGHVLCDELERAKEIIKETKNGKQIPLRMDLKPIYRPSDIQNARDIINEHRRLQSCMKRLNQQGVYGRW